MLTVLISTDTRYPVNRKMVRKAVGDVLAKYRMKKSDAEVSVAIVGARKMKDLTEKYLGDGRDHEVLSFPQEDLFAQGSDSERGFINPPDGVLRLGDVILSWPQVIEIAARDGVLVDYEVANLVAHGVEHLLGKHHE